MIRSLLFFNAEVRLHTLSWQANKRMKFKACEVLSAQHSKPM